MVKLSRKGVRKSNNRGRSRRSFKRGGSAFKGENGTFLRKDTATGIGKQSTLYKLTVNDDVYTLDFSVADLGFLIGIATGPKKYTNTLKEAFGVVGDNDNNSAVITGMMFALFNGGNNEAKKRKLKITKEEPNFKIELMTDNDTLMNGTISSPPTDIGTFLQKLSDDQLITYDT
jgi:hypothetical protein